MQGSRGTPWTFSERCSPFGAIVRVAGVEGNVAAAAGLATWRG